MATIYPTANYGYNVAHITTTSTALPAYARVNLTWAPDAPTIVQSKETSLTTDKLIESLFRLNPKAKEKYEGDKEKFAAAIVAAAEAVEQRNALADLTDLGLAE